MKLKTIAAVAILLNVLISFSLNARTLYVDSKVREAGTGTALRPYRLIQNALNRIQPGSIIKIAEGTYKEVLSVYQSGTRDAPVVIEPWKKGQPVIDASFFESSRHKAMLHLKNVSHIQVKGLAFKNFNATQATDAVYGILIEGSGENIVLENCEISGIKNTSNVSVSSAGLAALGQDARQPISNLQINNLVIHSCSGIGAAISLRGNVSGASIEGNHLHRNECSGIEIIGNQGVSPSILVDMPRASVIRRNYIHHLHRRSFSAGAYHPARAILVDSSEQVLIESSRIQECDVGIELIASRKGLGLKNVTVRNNWIQENESSGIVLGARDYKAGPTEVIRLINNTLVENDKANLSRGELHFRYHVDDCMVKNNLFIPNQVNDVSRYISQLSKKNIPNTLIMSHNFYVRRGATSIWQMGFRESLGYSSWMSKGFDRQSQWGDLLFDKNGIPHSFAQIRDKGDSTVSQSSEDVDGKPRVLGLGLDIGAKEW